MSLTMTQFAYTPEAWAALMRNPEDRSLLLKALVEKLGGRLLGMYYTFGEYDGVAIVELPDNVASMTAVLASIAPGHLRATKTTLLFTVAEAMQAMKKASTITLPRPKG